MKKFYSLFIVMMLCNLATSQPFSPREPVEKPKIFAHLPDTIPISKNTFTGLFEHNKGRQVVIDFTTEQKFSIKGTVVSNVVKYNNLVHSVTVHADDGRQFLVTRTLMPDGNISYSGIIMSKNAGDVYRLLKNGDEYILLKKTYNQVVNE